MFSFANRLPIFPPALVAMGALLQLGSFPALAGSAPTTDDLGGRKLLDLAAASATPLPDAVTLTLRISPALKSSSTCSDQPKGQLDFIDDGAANAHRDEAALIKASGLALHRDGPRLSFTPAQGKPLAFVDRSTPTKPGVDGDSVSYTFVGTLPGSNYLRIESHYGHDSPGSYLIEPVSGSVSFVHQGGEVTALSPDSKTLATFETLNAPYRLTITTLASGGPQIEVECTFNTGERNVSASACGWTDAGHFEIAWGDNRAIPFRFWRDGGHWALDVGPGELPVIVRCSESGNP